MASMMGAYIANEFSQGRFTGQMPTNKNEREALLRQKPGWQPNSYTFRKDKNMVFRQGDFHSDIY